MDDFGRYLGEPGTKSVVWELARKSGEEKWLARADGGIDGFDSEKEVIDAAVVDPSGVPSWDAWLVLCDIASTPFTLLLVSREPTEPGVIFPFEAWRK